MTQAEPIIIAAVEGGGTSFVVAVAEVNPDEQVAFGQAPPRILQREEIDSSHDDPTITLTQCATFFENHKPDEGYHALPQKTTMRCY